MKRNALPPLIALTPQFRDTLARDTLARRHPGSETPWWFTLHIVQQRIPSNSDGRQRRSVGPFLEGLLDFVPDLLVSGAGGQGALG